MSSPFTAFTNATITFKIPSGEATYGDFGHLVDTLKDFTVECYLQQSKPPVSNNFDDAVNQEGVYVQGRCTNPLVLDSNIQAQVLGDCLFNNLPFKFRYIPALPSAFYDENQILGQKIQGYLIKTTSWGGES